MVTARRLVITTLGLLGVLALPGPAPVSEIPVNWERLRAIPPELRSHLSDQLKAFTLLSRAEQEAVRALDRKIASEPEEARAADFAILRRYHLWLQSLSEAQRNELNATSPSKRFALVSKILADRAAGEKPEASFFRFADFGGRSPFDQAQQIAIWLKLTDARKAEVANLPEPERHKRLAQFARELKVSISRPPPSVTEAGYTRALESGRFPYLMKAEETKKQAALKHRFADNFYFVDNPPAKVNPDSLLQFDRALPVWVRGDLDTLPPEEARRRLSVLYRLVYPGGEIPAPDKVPAATVPARPVSPPGVAPPPPAKSASGPNPF